jgi:hypothetical protein
VLPAVGSMAAFATAVFLLLLARRSSIARLAPAGPVLEPAPSVCLSAGFLLSRFPRPPPAR